MNRRVKYLIGTVALIVVLLTPQLIRADDGLTLENLAESVQGLTSDFNIFARELVRVNDRVDVIEEQISHLKTAQRQNESAGEPCVVISKEGGHKGSANQLRSETLNDYIDKYGKAITGVFVYDVRFNPQDGILAVRYRPWMIDDYVLEVVEKWRACEFLGVEFEER